MSEWFLGWNPGEMIGLAAVVGGLTVPITALIAGAWQHVRRAETEAALKQEMIGKGMTAAEIAAVLGAGRKPAGGRLPESPIEFAALMSQHGHGAEAAEAVMRAFREAGGEARYSRRDFAALTTMLGNGYGPEELARVIRALPRPA